MGVITLLTSGGPLVLITSVVLTVLVSILLLWLYRRAVLHGMSVPAGADDAPRPAGPTILARGELWGATSAQ
jgi:hypothetical protein